MSSIYEPQHGAVAEAWWPLLAGVQSQRIVAWRGGQAVVAADFLADVAALAARLPVAQAAVNLCEDRYAFLVAFAALLARGQINLLPPSRAAHAIDAALRAYPDSYALGDTPLRPEPPDYVCFAPDGQGRTAPPMLVAGKAIAARRAPCLAAAAEATRLTWHGANRP